MKLIIAGGRDFNNYDLVKTTLDKLQHEIEIVCGEARGADSLGKKYAIENNLVIHSFPANWNKHGKSAGYLRNKEMAEFADALIAFWDGKSPGTAHMISLARHMKLKIKIIQY